MVKVSPLLRFVVLLKRSDELLFSIPLFVDSRVIFGVRVSSYHIESALKGKVKKRTCEGVSLVGNSPAH